MNWMTSGKHRALYSKRGRRRQMHFPSQVQHQRVKPTSPLRNSQQAEPRDATTPWYILPIGNDDESQDIRILELERKRAMTTAEHEVVEKKNEATQVVEHGNDEVLKQMKRRENEQDDQDRKGNSRCIFTPLKKARTYSQLQKPARSTMNEDRPPSSIASGINMRFFNNGKELLKKNKTQHNNRIIANQVPQETHQSHFTQPINFNESQTVEQPQYARHRYQEEDSHSHSKELHSQRQLFENKIDAHHTYADNEELDSQLWTENVDPRVDLSPLKAREFSHRDRAFSITRDLDHATPPSSPSRASPLSFKMSRAEVLQSQFSTKIPPPAKYTLNQTASSSPSPSMSSQSSLLLDRPPEGWQKRLLFARESSNNQPDDGFCVSVLSPKNDSMWNDTNIKLEKEFAAVPSDDDSVTSAVIPFDAKERIMAIVASQQSQRNIHKGQHILQSPTVSIDSSKKGLTLKQSWVMSSRTKTIFNAAMSLKTHSMETKSLEMKYLEMESVAVYMYTLVQCYKSDEKECADKSSLPSHDRTPVSYDASPALEKKIRSHSANRCGILFSPKCTN